MEYNPNVLDDIPARILEKQLAETKTNNDSTSVDINDIRMSQDFRGVSFSGYKISDVRTQLVNSLLNGKIEPACYWSAELICAGHLGDLWEIIIQYMSKHIHLGNPKLAIYLEMRYDNFRNIMLRDIQVSDLDVRNNDKIRKLFSEIICTLALSSKKPSIESIKINREEEYDITQMSQKLRAPTMEYAQPIFQPKDPRELFIALNELAYCVSSERSNMLTACYWVEWIIEFNTICKKRKDPITCELRNKYKVENKLRSDVIWMVWDILLHYSEKQSNLLVKKTMNALVRLFSIKYTTPSSKKRRYLLYFAVSILTETISANVELIIDRKILQTVTDKIDSVYKQIKRNEEAPKTDYLFKGLEKKRALEKSLKQMELLGQMDNT